MAPHVNTHDCCSKTGATPILAGGFRIYRPYILYRGLSYKVQYPDSYRGGSRIFLKGGSVLGLEAKERGGGQGGPTLGPILKSLQRGPKGGGS